jgi:hypothetical protein
VRLPMVMPDDRLAIAAALEMCAGVAPAEARIVRIRNTLRLRRMWVSEELIGEVEKNPKLRLLEEPAPMRFDEEGNLTG